jgi:hypothetical protein
MSLTFFFLLFFSLLVEGAIVSVLFTPPDFSTDGLDALLLPLAFSLLLLPAALAVFAVFLETFSYLTGIVTEIPFFVIT